MRTSPDAMRPPIDSWNAEVLRMTAFVVETLDPGANNWWDQVMDAPPDTTRDERREGYKIQTAQFEGGLLNLTVTPRTIEWAFVVPDPPSGEFQAVPLGQHLEPFRRVVHEWLAGCPALSRLAFGCILRLPIGSREEGYEQISRYLNFNLDPGSFDFNYQINRPRRSAVVGPDLRINRLSRWSVGRLIQWAVIGDQVRPGSSRSYCRLELDVNTDGERTEPLPSQSLRELYDELISMGREVVEEGDIP